MMRLAGADVFALCVGGLGLLLVWFLVRRKR